jgi:hypothetical protein
MAALAKLPALCAGAAGTVACMATGVLPAPDLTPEHPQRPPIERAPRAPARAPAGEAVQYEPAPVATPKPEPKPKAPPGEEAEVASPEATGAIEYEPPAVPESPSAPASGGESSTSSGSPAGEFGP